MLEDEGVEEDAGGLLFVLVELTDGLELEPELFVGPALVLFKHQRVGRDPEGAGELARRKREGWAVPAS